MVRGIEGEKIFKEDQDRYNFIDRLGQYPFSGHGISMGKFDLSWKDWTAVPVFFDKQPGPARHGYRAFVTKGIEAGRRNDPTGGGLIRSSGGWAAVKAIQLRSHTN